ncbi:MAG: histidine phosphatase family protein [Alphaproteobacteria bacterium]|nr:histidine phosphatase family protein [Alphaproteobacteria bacterium]
MTTVAFIRHGPTGWNAEGRLQGRADTPLNDAGRAMVASWRMPAEIAGFAVLASPLRRARETAAILGHRAPDIDDRLVERDWGDWSGRLRADCQPDIDTMGADMAPPGGESAAAVAARVAAVLADITASGAPRLIVAHRGIIRAAYALATGWDMRGAPPAKLSRKAAHLFALAADGTPSVLRLNLRLDRGGA